MPLESVRFVWSKSHLDLRANNLTQMDSMTITEVFDPRNLMSYRIFYLAYCSDTGIDVANFKEQRRSPYPSVPSSRATDDQIPQLCFVQCYYVVFIGRARPINAVFCRSQKEEVHA